MRPTSLTLAKGGSSVLSLDIAADIRYICSSHYSSMKKPSGTETYSRWNSLQSEEDLSEPRYNEFGMPNERRESSEGMIPVDDLEHPAKWPSFTLPEDDEEYAEKDSDTHSLSSITTSIPDPKYSEEKEENETISIPSFFMKWPIRDSSWLTATTFTVGSAVFVINSFFLLLPMVEPGMNFEGEGEYAGPATSILGTLLFLVGSWAQIVEALNIKRGEVNGIGIDAEDEPGLLEKEVEEGEGHSREHLRLVDTSLSTASKTKSALIGSREFIWAPSMYELRAYYLRNPMFIGALAQVVGAVIFAIATVTGVMDISNPFLLNTLSLLPTLVGSLCFLVAGLIQMAATQETWYIPTPWRLAWHMGFWNSVGALGFALAGGLPYIGHPAAMFQATLATFWGSWSFLIGSAVQWIVVMENYSASGAI